MTADATAKSIPADIHDIATLRAGVRGVGSVPRTATWAKICAKMLTLSTCRSTNGQAHNEAHLKPLVAGLTTRGGREHPRPTAAGLSDFRPPGGLRRRRDLAWVPAG